MQSAEIELKFPVDDPAHLQAQLPGLGFHLETPRTFEHNTLYDTPARDLRARHHLLRVRHYGDLCVLTHKRLPEIDEAGSRYKTRIETETSVSDGEALSEVLRQLGYTAAFVYDKFRTVWAQKLTEGTTGDAHLVIDETPIGTWAELEGPVHWIDQALDRLGIDSGTCLTDSYGKLFLDWKERSGSPAEHLTFEAVGNLSLAVG